MRALFIKALLPASDSIVEGKNGMKRIGNRVSNWHIHYRDVGEKSQLFNSLVGAEV